MGAFRIADDKSDPFGVIWYALVIPGSLRSDRLLSTCPANAKIGIENSNPIEPKCFNSLPSFLF